MRLQRRLMKRKNGEDNARSVSGVRESGSAAGGDRRAQYEGLSLSLPTCAHTNIAIDATGLPTESANSKNKPDRKSREGRVVSWIDNSDRNRMLVCDAFLRKVCSLSCCPLAHPGLRDSALVNVALLLFMVPLDFIVSHLCRAVELCTIRYTMEWNLSSTHSITRLSVLYLLSFPYLPSILHYPAHFCPYR